MATTKISSAGAHAFGASTDRIPASKGPFSPGAKGYVSPAQMRRPYTRNRTPANLKTFWTKLNRALQETSDNKVRINMLGDSLTMGSGGDFQRNSLSERLAISFRSLGFDARAFKHALHTSAAATATFDPRYAFTGTWANFGEVAGGGSFRCTSAGGTIVYTPGFSHDTVDVLWLRNTVVGGGGGDMTITVDGGATNFSTPSSGGSVATETISQTGSLELRKTTVTIASAGTHAITITNGASNNIQIVGFEAYTAANPAIIIRNLGMSGSTSTDWANANRRASLWQNSVLLCELTTLCLGVNDQIAATSLATYAANLATLRGDIDVLVNSVLYWTWNPTATSVTAEATQQTYIDQLITSAGSNTVVADMWRRWTDIGGQAALAPSTGAGLYDDTIHYNSVGALDIADVLFDAIYPGF